MKNKLLAITLIAIVVLSGCRQKETAASGGADNTVSIISGTVAVSASQEQTATQQEKKPVAEQEKQSVEEPEKPPETPKPVPNTNCTGNSEGETNTASYGNETNAASGGNETNMASCRNEGEHSFVKEYWPCEPTCSRSGYYNLICSVCRANGGDGTDPVLPHMPVTREETGTQAFYCDEHGVLVTECSVCGAEIDRHGYSGSEHEWVDSTYQEFNVETLEWETKNQKVCTRCGARQ